MWCHHEPHLSVPIFFPSRDKHVEPVRQMRYSEVERFLFRVYEKSFVAQCLRCQIQVRTIVIHTIHSDEAVNIADQVTAGTGHRFGSRIEKHRTSKHHTYGIGFIDPVDHHESQ